MNTTIKKSKIRNFIISSAIVWGAVLIYVAYLLKGTEFKNEIIGVIAGGIIFQLIFLWIPLGKQLTSKNKDNI